MGDRESGGVASVVFDGCAIICAKSGQKIADSSWPTDDVTRNRSPGILNEESSTPNFFTESPDYTKRFTTFTHILEDGERGGKKIERGS